jgi:hypothetical protein
MFTEEKPLPLSSKSVLWAAVGTGSVFMALAQGSGELIWWPYIIGKYGLAFLFLLLPACLMQYPVTYGICRYTSLTGESILRGFFRFDKRITFVLWILFSISFLWFGAYATAGATALAELFPSIFHETKHNVYFWSLLSIGIYFTILFIGRSAYGKIEKMMMFVAAVTVIGLIISLFQSRVSPNILPALKHTIVPGALTREWDKVDSLRLLTAIMFAGLGGFWNLFNSYWIIAKRNRIIKEADPRHEDDEFSLDKGACPSVDNTDPTANSFWRRFSHAHVGFGVAGNYITTLLMCILAYSFLTPTGEVPYGWKLAVVQSKFFSGVSWGPALFLMIAALFLIDTWITTLDAVAKSQVDFLKMYFPVKFKSLTNRTMYYFIALVVLGLTLVTMFLSQPDALLLINGFISAAAMPVLIALIYSANYKILPAHIWGKETFMKISLGLTGIMYAALFLGYLAYR